MRALLDPEGPDPSTAEGLRARYAPPARAWVRANFVAAVDGGVSVDGTSGALGGDADTTVFALLRELADVVLVGAGTVRAESYGPLDPDPATRARRIAAGRAEVPRLAVVGRASSWTGDERWIADATAAPLLLTTAADAVDVAGCETLVCGPDHIEPATALDLLAGHGLTSVLCEGGPGLFAQLADSGRLDELCLTLSPVLAGPEPGRIVTGDAWEQPRPLRLVGLLEADGLLLARYRTV